MKSCLRISEMIDYLPSVVKDAIWHTAKETGNKTESLELHRHTHSEKAKINELEPESRKSLSYVSVRTQDRDDEIVIPQSLKLDEFRKYASVLVNHNYSLLPVGSDETIECDDWGIRALTKHADTGAGTLANVVWDLVRQGHLKGRSVGFVPTAFTKPGARDWDHVANQLQNNWKEFDKARAEKSVSRIITDGVLLEHSFVSVPCNTDANLIGVVKSMNLDGKIIKQLGLEEKQEKVPSVCDECGYVADAVPGSKCPECKTGDMKAKGKEKAIEVRVIGKGMGSLNTDELRQALNKILFPQTSPGMVGTGYVNDIYEDHFIYQKQDEMFSQGYAVVENKPQLVGEPVKVERRTAYVTVVGNENKGFHSHAVEKPNPHMPGGSFSACVLIMEDKGHNSESAKKICGALQADAGGKGLTEAETKAVREAKEYYTACVCNECGAEADTNPGEPCTEEGCNGKMKPAKKKKAIGIPCTCDECGAEDECAPGSSCQEDDCEGVMRASKKMEKEYTPVVTVVKPAPQIKVLYTPPDAELIAKGVSEAVEKVLARRTGKIL